MRILIVLVLWASITSIRADNLLVEGNFAGSDLGAPPPHPWTSTKPAPDVSVVVENPPNANAEERWLHLIDNSSEENAGVVQKFSEISGGRLHFRMHVLKSDAAIWFLLGGNDLNRRQDAVLGFKITSKGNLLVAQDRQKIANTNGARVSFPGGETYDLYCDFKPNGDRLEIEIGQKDGTVLFNGVSQTGAPISALSIRTHGEEAGSDFYVTDLVLESNSGS